jgi:hypothetical protein
VVLSVIYLMMDISLKISLQLVLKIVYSVKLQIILMHAQNALNLLSVQILLMILVRLFPELQIMISVY